MQTSLQKFQDNVINDSAHPDADKYIEITYNQQRQNNMYNVEQIQNDQQDDQYEDGEMNFPQSNNAQVIIDDDGQIIVINDDGQVIIVQNQNDQNEQNEIEVENKREASNENNNDSKAISDDRQTHIAQANNVVLDTIEPKTLNQNTQILSEGFNLLNPQLIEFKCTQLIFDSIVLIEESQIWKPTIATICPEHLHIRHQVIPINQIEKVKVLPDFVHKKYHKIKITHLGKQRFIAVDIKEKSNDMPLHFAWFSQIIEARLKNKGMEFPDNTKSDQDQTLSKLKEDAFIGGNIIKKSKYRKRWDLRYTLINKEGLFSYKNVNKPHSFSVESNTIQYMWTRFDFQDKMLIVKIMHGNHDKTEFGFPIMDFNMKVRHNWLYQLYRMMMEQKGQFDLAF